MKHLPPSSSRRLAVLAAAFGLVLLAAPAARAFTMDNQSNSNADGSARYTDPDARFSGSGDGKTVIRQGNTTLQFGSGQSFDQKYNADRMFNPIGRPGDDRSGAFCATTAFGARRGPFCFEGGANEPFSERKPAHGVVPVSTASMGRELR